MLTFPTMIPNEINEISSNELLVEKYQEALTKVFEASKALARTVPNPKHYSSGKYKDAFNEHQQRNNKLLAVIIELHAINMDLTKQRVYDY